MSQEDCPCRDCLCFNGTSSRSKLCPDCAKGAHPGDERPYRTKPKR